MEPVDLAIVGRLYSGLGISALPIIPRITSLYTNITLHFASSIEDLKNNPNLSKISCALYIPRGYLDVLEYLIDHAGNLKWIHNWVVGVDPIASVIKNKLVGSDIALTNARGAFSASLAEWVLAVSLHFVKEIPRVMENTKRSNWDVFPMHQIKGKTMGFLGFGDIAKASARVAKVFGMKIIACRKCNKVDHKDLVDDLYLFSDDGIAKVLAEADIVVSSLPATDETRNCLGYEQFSLMKSSAIFISIGRGCVVVEDGLAKVLKEKIIYGAALDVFQMEPLPQTSPLWSLPNILVTAHNADREPNFVALSFDIWIRNFNAFLKGARHNEEFLTPVDKTLGY
ncbi:erythronate-4-phosphate dehydrogenase domain-containing protein [Cardiosporidium cionae]|uniref:Erythronate-4-phosphate dehydrogenase domain-containing protein n=1 Tax=Cardiosporidium cionae TaxID=476202 RepID=A0ABQ7JE29_9APIC|nr:erythronate-4-phosphate dehydrogenase domain-containing protein [Cardiosporidium cionae]|eukprot:KAF8822236.1 erythronate-4-phosphate dehydrogenase domain-containing protein [Cardiosporidium cionae]